MIRKLVALSAALFSMGLSLSASTVQFAARQDIPTGAQHLTGLAIADFNGDGKLDLAVTDDYAQKIIVYLNNGTGGFGAPIVTTLNVPNIGGLGALVVGDVNEDGKQDLIVAPVAGLQYDVVLLGRGDGTFTQNSQIMTSYGFESASLVDVNGDKHLDLVAGANGSVYVHLGDGKGNFAQQMITSPGSDLFLSLTTGDFNNDKRIDFIVTKYLAGQLSYFAGNGDGSFQSSTTLQPAGIFSPESLASADFNGDGNLDLLVGSSDIASLVLGNGNGTFQTGPTQVNYLPLAPTTNYGSTNGPVVATADMDGNGTPDVVAADDGSGMLSLLLNDGTGKFLKPNPDFSAPVDIGSGVLQLADLNGDGLPDVILTNYKTQNVSIFLSLYPKTSPMVSIQSSAAQTLVGGSVTVAVQVKGTGSKTPTGTVSLSSGSTSYGQQPLSSSGAATFTLANLAAGQYPLTASYAGDMYNNAAVSATAFTQAITDFQITLPTATQTVAAGASATYSLSLTPIAGFNGSIALTCSGLPAGYTCSSTAATLSGQAATANVLVSPPAHVELKSPSWFGAARGVTWCMLLGLCMPWRRRMAARCVLFVVLSLSVGTMIGCGGSGANQPALYTGTSSFIITATTTSGSQTVSHQITATLVVQ